MAKCTITVEDLPDGSVHFVFDPPLAQLARQPDHQITSAQAYVMDFYLSTVKPQVLPGQPDDLH